MITITTSKKVLLGAAALGLALVGGTAAAGIAETKHNLGRTTTWNSNFVSGGADQTNEICVFCHTPHGSDSSAAVPLWNKNLTAADTNTYSSYADLGTSTLDAATAVTGSVSIACLSCHDGTQAMDNIINMAGSGGYIDSGDSGTAKEGRAMSWTSYGVTSGGGNISLDGKLQGADNIAYIGTDLKNDHPVGIQYAGGPTLTVDGTYGIADRSDFRDQDFNTLKFSGTYGDGGYWWVETGGNTTRNKTDIILYTRDTADEILDNGTWGQTGAQPFVECASCHDPHSSEDTFLRISNSQSSVCLACHVK